MNELTQKQKEMVQSFYHERWGQYSVIENDNAFEIIADSLYEKFVTLSHESRKLRNMGKILVTVAIVFGLVGWFYKGWIIALTIFGIMLVFSFIIGGLRSSKCAKNFGWTPDEINSAMSLVTDPEWQTEMKKI